MVLGLLLDDLLFGVSHLLITSCHSLVCLILDLLVLKDDDLFGILLFVVLLRPFLPLHVVELEEDILLERLLLVDLPLVPVELAGFESEADFILSELTILTHGVEADDKLNFGSLELLIFWFGPLSDFWNPFLTVFEGIFLGFSLFIIPLDLFFLLFLHLFLDVEVVLDSGIERLLK